MQQGQTAQAQIAINNGGTGLLTGLSAGTFSNYFDGSPAPWVTATFNMTTAPAIMTITASPDLNVAPGVHQLRFDVMAPGASNSPYTFYSINITVIDRNITPVNATISPSATSIYIEVAQGRSAHAQLAINNTGTDPLTNLQAGSFSNYFNGSPAPWVTAGIAPTTAPATLTIAAPPGLTVPVGEHHLRFDVTSPGATNSPFTFYSVRVNVTPAPTIIDVTTDYLWRTSTSGLGNPALAVWSDGAVLVASQTPGQAFVVSPTGTRTSYENWASRPSIWIPQSGGYGEIAIANYGALSARTRDNQPAWTNGDFGCCGVWPLGFTLDPSTGMHWRTKGLATLDLRNGQGLSFSHGFDDGHTIYVTPNYVYWGHLGRGELRRLTRPSGPSVITPRGFRRHRPAGSRSRGR